MAWLDAARVVAICGVVALHTSVNSDGEPFPAAEPHARIFPVIFRTLAEVASPEFFILVSLLLLASKLDRRNASYAEVARRAAFRLLVPFVAWTGFYVVWRYAVAALFGLDQDFVDRCREPASWLGFLLLGNVQYHMYFLPMLFALTLLYPAYRIAVSRPSAAAVVVLLLYFEEQLSLWFWAEVNDPLLRDYLLRLIKVLVYSGYGLVAFALFGILKRGLSRVEAESLTWFAAVCFAVGLVVQLTYAAVVIEEGHFGAQREMVFYARFLLPIVLLAWFAGSRHLAWTPLFGRLAGYGYGVYLLHPALIDVYEITAESLRISPALYVLCKFGFTLTTSFVLVVALASTRASAWAIGHTGPAGAPSAAKAI